MTTSVIKQEPNTYKVKKEEGKKERKKRGRSTKHNMPVK